MHQIKKATQILFVILTLIVANQINVILTNELNDENEDPYSIKTNPIEQSDDYYSYIDANAANLESNNNELKFEKEKGKESGKQRRQLNNHQQANYPNQYAQQMPNGPNVVHHQFPYIQGGGGFPSSYNQPSFTQAYQPISSNNPVNPIDR